MARRRCRQRWQQLSSRVPTARSALTRTGRPFSTTGSCRSPRRHQAPTSRESRPAFASRRWTRRLVDSSARRPRRRAGPTQPAPRKRRRPGLETRHPSTSAPETSRTDETGGVSETPPPIDSAAPILQLRGVGRRVGGLRAAAAVTLAVKPGERRAILAPNGAGQTTLFYVISRELPPP